MRVRFRVAMRVRRGRIQRQTIGLVVKMCRRCCRWYYSTMIVRPAATVIVPFAFRYGQGYDA